MINPQRCLHIPAVYPADSPATHRHTFHRRLPESLNLIWCKSDIFSQASDWLQHLRIWDKTRPWNLISRSSLHLREYRYFLLLCRRARNFVLLYSRALVSRPRALSSPPQSLSPSLRSFLSLSPAVSQAGSGIFTVIPWPSQSVSRIWAASCHLIPRCLNNTSFVSYHYIRLVLSHK